MRTKDNLYDNDSNEIISTQKKNPGFLPEIFKMALNNMKTEKKFAKYLEKQAKKYPKQYEQAIREYVEEKLSDRTGLMRHVSFFDPENTSELTFFNIVQGFNDLGFNLVTAFLNTCLVMLGPLVDKQKTKQPIKDVHNLQHPVSHTGLFNQNTKKINNGAHDKLVEQMVDKIMNGRERLEEKDIAELVNEVSKRHAVTGPKILGKALLKPLQRYAFNNVKSICGDEGLTKENFINLFKGTLFYTKVEPSKVAHKIMTLRNTHPETAIDRPNI